MARVGIKAAVKQYTKTQIKKAAKSYLLKNLNRNGWKHIMQAKHNWYLVGAKSREQIAEIIGTRWPMVLIEWLENMSRLVIGTRVKRLLFAMLKTVGKFLMRG